MPIISKIRRGDTTISLKKKGNKYTIETDIKQPPYYDELTQSMEGQEIVVSIAEYLGSKYECKTTDTGRMRAEDDIKIPGGLDLSHYASFGYYTLDSIGGTTSKQKALKTWNEIKKANEEIQKSEYYYD